MAESETVKKISPAGGMKGTNPLYLFSKNNLAI